jgi:hypothetical protein
MARKLPHLALILAVLGTLIALVGSGVSTAATPPNSHDPCAQNGRDVCGTTGVGAYHQYAFGLRWFGDYRGAVPGVSGPTFCIDLNYWFPGRSYKYVQHTVGGLRNRNGTLISAATLSRISYAIWNDGRSNDPTEQSAVMLYVHGQIADAPAAQVARNSIGSAVSADYAKVTAAAAKYAGPYTLSVSTASRDIAGDPTPATIKVLSASGAAVPDVAFSLNIKGATGPSTATSGANGIATVSLTPTDTSGLSVRATATGLAANAPTLYVPSARAALASGQRLVAPASQTVSGTQTAAVSLITPTVTSAATPATLNVDSPDVDTVTIKGLPSGYGQTATVNVYGPAASQAAITCTGTPAAALTLPAANGTAATGAFTPGQGGWYGYQIVLPGTSTVAATTTPCAPTSESFDATLATPTVSSQATPASLTLGATNTDSVTIGGLPAGDAPQATVELFGPASTQSAIDCSGTPVQSVSFPAVNGTTAAPAVTPATVGWYGYQVVVSATNASDGVTSPCAPAPESFEVTTAPTVHTQVSSASEAPGSSLFDTVDVSGLQGQPATVTADLYGPFSSATALKCTGTPVWTGSIPVTGDGTYQTASTKLPTPGYYVYAETIAAQGFVQAASDGCADSAESTLVTGTPVITTKVSDATITPGGTLQDHATISGLGNLPAKVHVVLWGPFSSASAITCSGSQAWSGNFVAADGDGAYLTKRVTVAKAGYYVYQESIGASATYAAVSTDCADAAETSVAQPDPSVVTQPSAAVVVPGGSVFDQIKVSGIGSTPATIGVKLYGPFSALSQLSCTGTPYWSGRVSAAGDGTINSAKAVIHKVGFYVYRETVLASGSVPALSTPCVNLPETVLGRPQIITGPGVATFGPNPAGLSIPAAEAPTAMSIPALNLQAPIDRDAISVKTGQMEIPPDVKRVGWWQDGAAPAQGSGTTLVFGHINYANQGPGAFSALAMAGDGKGSVNGDLVDVRTADGRTYTYRIVSVTRMLKANLPTSIFTKTGPRKLVMVTCGGALDPHTHHYVDNVVVTAVPA